MSDSYLMGVDIGVSFIKSGIYDTFGNMISQSIVKNPGEYPDQGIFLQSSNKILELVIKSIRGAVSKSKIETIKIEAISFSGAMGGIMGVDKNWEPVAEWTIISDTRFYPQLNEMLKNYSNEILASSGTNLPVFAPKILWWKKEFPEIYKKITRVLGICGFIIGKLGNLKVDDAVMDSTITVFSGFADLENFNWSEKMCSILGIDMKILPKIVSPNTIVSKLSKEAAGQCGLRPGIPLIAGAGDKAAGNLGAGIVEPGMLIDEAATYGALSVCVDKFIPDLKYKTLENLPSPVEGLYTSLSFIIGSGAISAWFADTFAAEENKIAEKQNRSVFRLLDENSFDIPAGSDGLFSISLLLGRGFPSDPDIRGMWVGHTMIHKKEYFYRSLLEGFAYEYAHTFNVMKKNYPWLNFEEVLVMGGGSKSDFYNQIKCDVLGIPFTRLERDDFALLGNILMAGNAVGIFPDLKKDAKIFVSKGKKYYPDKNNYAIYKKYTEFNSGIYDRVRQIYVDLKNIGSS